MLKKYWKDNKIIFILCLLLMLCLVGCQNHIVNPDNINCHTFEIKNNARAMNENGFVYKENGKDIIVNEDKWIEFKEKVDKKEKMHIDIAMPSKEGDWIIYCVNFDGNEFVVIADTSRDKHYPIDVEEYKYTSLEEVSIDGVKYSALKGNESKIVFFNY